VTLLRELIEIPESVGDSDFVVRASGDADLGHYVVTDQLKRNFTEALEMVGHALAPGGRSQAKFLHGSFGSGKSHFMAVLREILRHNPAARAVRNLAEPVAAADPWLTDKKILTLAFHMLDAHSVEQAVLEGYLNQIADLHPDAPAPAVHRSDALLADAGRLRERMGDAAFFQALAEAGVSPGGSGNGLAAMRARQAGWTPRTYAVAAAGAPGTEQRDALVSALTTAFFTGAVRSGEYLDFDTGLAVITRHARELGYDAMVLFLDEFILWLSTRLADNAFVRTEGAKLNKLVESSDADRPLPVISFVAQQRYLEEFLGPQVGGTEREALAHVMRSVQGRLGEIVLADTNLPEITEKRLLRPKNDTARQVIDDAFAAVRGSRQVWDTLLLGAQYGDAGIGSDAAAFRRLYPFSPALVATLVALSQALQRERTALKIMTEMLSARRNTLQVNDLIGVAELFEPLVLHGELPDRPKLKQLFRDARETYQQKLRPLLLALNKIGEAEADTHEGFRLDDKLTKTLLLSALVPEVPALRNLTAAKLHALNFGSIASPIPGYENQIVLDRMKKLAADAGEVTVGEGPDPVITLKLSSVDYDRLLDLVPNNETMPGSLQRIIRELVASELGLAESEGTFGDLPYQRDWRGRRHVLHVRFGNVRDRDALPDSAVVATSETWRVIVDYPFDSQGHTRSSDRARIETLLGTDSRTVFWLPLFLTDEMMSRVGQLAKINYLLGDRGTGDRLNTLAADWSVADRQQGKVYLQQRRQQISTSLLGALKQAYGVAKPEPADVEEDPIGVLHTLAEGLRLGDPRGGTLRAAFENLTAELLEWAYPGKPHLPDDERPVTRGELGRVLLYAKRAAADETRGTTVDPGDRKTVQRICNRLELGELAEHRYVLTTSNCWWSRHFLTEAAKRGYTEHFPVTLLLELLDKPAPHGFDRDLKHLILAVFALDQQLAWYQHGAKVEVNAVQAINDQLQLRHPPMPSPEAWDKAIDHGKPLFGKPLPQWRSPATLGELAGTMREVARQYAAHAAALVTGLTEHADILGLSEGSGRLGTARRVAALLKAIADERDDVVLVDLVAQADVGGIDFAAAGTAFKQAPAVNTALEGTPWPLLEAAVGRAASDERFRAVVEELRAAARHDQHAVDLVTALRVAADETTRLLAGPPIVGPPPRVVVPPVIGPPVVTPPVVVSAPRGSPAEIHTEVDLDGVVTAIKKELSAGRAVRVTWEPLP
jgi:hypothetical protein